MQRLIFILISIIPGLLNAQTDRSKFLYTSDGKLIGEKKELVESCATELEDDSSFSKSDREEVCECMLGSLASHLTYKELNKMTDGEALNVEKLFMNKKHPEMGNMLMQCIFAFLRNGNPEKGSVYRKQFVEECISGFQEEAKGLPVGAIDAEYYCQCMIDKLIANESLGENFFKQVEDENSTLMKDAVLPCMLEAMSAGKDSTVEADTSAAPDPDADYKTETTGLTNQLDVTGDIVSQEIMLTKYLNIYRLKIRIGTIEKSFILDSGASDVLISKDFEKELLKAGLLTKADLIGDKLYVLADGTKVKGKVYVLSGLQVGGFTINNVMAGVISEDASLLLGKSFLDKFRKWHIDNERKTLYLEK